MGAFGPVNCSAIGTLVRGFVSGVGYPRRKGLSECGLESPAFCTSWPALPLR
jgi:hypothetical protein